MKYIYFLLLLTIGYAQEKQRYLMIMMPTDVKEFSFQHTVSPDIGTPKSIPILLDTHTGKTWTLVRVPIVTSATPDVEWKWKEIKFADPSSLIGSR